jgi:hypothetical protein
MSEQDDDFTPSSAPLHQALPLHLAASIVLTASVASTVRIEISKNAHVDAGGARLGQ